MEISWTDLVRNEKVITQSQGEEYSTYSKKKAKWIGHILYRNCHLKHVIEGDIRRGKK